MRPESDRTPTTLAAGQQHVAVAADGDKVLLILFTGEWKTRAWMPPAKAREVSKALEDAAKAVETKSQAPRGD